MTKQNKLKNISSSLLGNVIEFYDFMIFAYSATYFSKLFFAGLSPYIGLMFVYTIQAFGYLSRPFGALLFGHIADKFGRQKSLIISIVLIGIATTAIGLLPTTEQIGIIAVILLAILRTIQGIALSGEEGSAVTYLCEIFSTNKKSLVSSFVIASVNIGILLGSGTCLLMDKIFSPSAMLDYGWRIPFLLALPLCIITYILRKESPESRDFLDAKNNNKILNIPAKELFTNYKTKLIGLTLTTGSFSILTCFYTIIFPNNLGFFAGIPRQELLFSIFWGLLIVGICTPIWGYFVDKIGYYKGMVISIIGGVIFATIGINFLFANNTYHLIICNISLVMTIILVSAPIFPLIVSTFPTEIRCSGVNFVFNTTIAFCFGLFPILATYILNRFSNYIYLNIVIIILLSLSVVGLRILSSNKNNLAPSSS